MSIIDGYPRIFFLCCKTMSEYRPEITVIVTIGVYRKCGIQLLKYFGMLYNELSQRAVCEAAVCVLIGLNIFFSSSPMQKKISSSKGMNHGHFCAASLYLAT